MTCELVPSAAVDRGGTKVRVAIADLTCRVICEETASTDPRGGVDVVTRLVRAMTAERLEPSAT